MASGAILTHCLTNKSGHHTSYLPRNRNLEPILNELWMETVTGEDKIQKHDFAEMNPNIGRCARQIRSDNAITNLPCKEKIKLILAKVEE